MGPCRLPGLVSASDRSKVETHEENERRPLFVEKTEGGKVMLLKDCSDDDDHKVVVENRSLAIQMKPHIVMLRVSMHCNGCAKKVEKHVSKIEGVSCYKVDLESKMVVDHRRCCPC